MSWAMSDMVMFGIIGALTASLAVFIASRRGAKLEPRILEELQKAGGSLRLPQLVVAVGLKDSFINRGKLIQAVAPLVRRGAVAEDDDPAATARTRLELKTFRLVH